MLGGLWFAVACALVAIVYGALQSRWIVSLPAGNARMQEIAAAVREGASAYLKRQYTTIAVVGAISTRQSAILCMNVFGRASNGVWSDHHVVPRLTCRCAKATS